MPLTLSSSGQARPAPLPESRVQPRPSAGRPPTEVNTLKITRPRKTGVPPWPAPASMATAPNPAADIIPQLPKRGGGERGWGGGDWDHPPTPRNRAEAAGWPHFLPASSLVSWSHSLSGRALGSRRPPPGRAWPGRQPRRRRSRAARCDSPAPSPAAFPPGQDPPASRASCVLPSPHQAQVPWTALSSCCPQCPEQGGGRQRGLSAGILCTPIPSSHPPTPRRRRVQE